MYNVPPPLLRPLSPLNVERMQDLGLYQYSTSVMDPGISKLGDMVPVEFLAFEICFHGAPAYMFFSESI